MDLKCKKLDCVYNKEFSCCAKGINVKSSLACATFSKNENLTKEQKQNVSRTMFEVAPSMHPYRHAKKVDIYCEAGNCVFNDGGNCKSNGITVSRSAVKAYCSTAIKKMWYTFGMPKSMQKAPGVAIPPEPHKRLTLKK